MQYVADQSVSVNCTSGQGFIQASFFFGGGDSPPKFEFPPKMLAEITYYLLFTIAISKVCC